MELIEITVGFLVVVGIYTLLPAGITKLFNLPEQRGDTDYLGGDGDLF